MINDVHLYLYGAGFIILITSWPQRHAASPNVWTKLCSYVHCLRRVYQHPMHVRRRLHLEREGMKDHLANNICQAVLYTWSTQQLIITVEAN